MDARPLEKWISYITFEKAAGMTSQALKKDKELLLIMLGSEIVSLGKARQMKANVPQVK